MFLRTSSRMLRESTHTVHVKWVLSSKGHYYLSVRKSAERASYSMDTGGSLQRGKGRGAKLTRNPSKLLSILKMNESYFNSAILYHGLYRTTLLLLRPALYYRYSIQNPSKKCRNTVTLFLVVLFFFFFFCNLNLIWRLCIVKNV